MIQELLVIMLVVLATGVVLRRLWRFVSARKSKCDGCSYAAPTENRIS